MPSVAHELFTPLATLMGAPRLLCAKHAMPTRCERCWARTSKISSACR